MALALSIISLIISIIAIALTFQDALSSVYDFIYQKVIDLIYGVEEVTEEEYNKMWEEYRKNS